MPLNDYKCEQCGGVVEDKYTPTFPEGGIITCPTCGGQAKKLIGSFMMMIGKRVPYLYQSKFREGV
jgi:putative FmdB family regulatory protein